VTVPWFVGAGLLVGLAATAANADETPTRVFHIGIVSGTPRSHPANVAFEDRLRELGYIEGRNLTIDFVWGDDTDRMAEAVGELAHRGVDVILPAGQQAVLTAAFTASAARSPPVFSGRSMSIL
jgi:putative ABC transport system substrate-binding protein